MRPWAYKAATSAMVTAIAYGGIAATSLVQGHAPAAPPPPARALGPLLPAVQPHLSPGTASRTPGPPASLSPVLAQRISPAPAAPVAAAPPSAAPSNGSAAPVPAPAPAHTTAPSPAPSPNPEPSPRRSPSCVGVAAIQLEVCAGISITTRR